MQQTEIGKFKLKINGNTFNLLPSLRNMAKLADSKRVLVLYEMIHSPKVPEWLKLDIGRDILLACSDNEGIDKYLIKTKRQKPVLNDSKISINDQVVVAAALMRHGIAGVNRPKYEGSKKSSDKEMVEFNINKIVADSMNHFGLSRNEAWDQTMSEFSHSLASKFPVDNSKETDVPSLDAHRAAMQKLMEKK